MFRIVDKTLDLVSTVLGTMLQCLCKHCDLYQDEDNGTIRRSRAVLMSSPAQFFVP